jgi:hypothetical protein
MSKYCVVARMERREACVRFWLGKRPLVRPRRRWEGNISIDIQEVGCGGYGGLAQDTDRWRAIVNAVMNLRVP